MIYNNLQNDFNAAEMRESMSDFDERDKDEKKEELENIETAPEEKESEKSGNDEKKDSEYEDVCFICRRPESKAGKMFKLPNNISVCNDCMHKTMDTVSQFDYQGMLSDPSFVNDLNTGFLSAGMNDLSVSDINAYMACITHNVSRLGVGIRNSGSGTS